MADLISSQEVLIDRLCSLKDAVTPFLIAIDGPSCSGKTTLAQAVSSSLSCPVFHMDDFYLRPEQRTRDRYAEPGGNVDRERFLAEVLLPLHDLKPFEYRPFDCQTMKVTEGNPVPICPIAVIEGSYALHPELSPYYTCRILLRVSKEQQSARVIRREGKERAQAFFDRWFPLENLYFEETHPEDRADLILDLQEAILH